MRYKKIYDSIIEKAKNRNSNEYTEKHHIVPKCLGGNNLKENIVNLTFREHFLCHRLLCKIYPENEKLVYAFSCMIRVSRTNCKRLEILTSKHFEIVKKTIKPFYGKWNLGKKPWNKGIKGDEYKQKFSSGLQPPNHSGSKWINNGLEDKKLPANQEIPPGWIRGRLKMKLQNPMKNKEIALKNINSRRKNESKENK